MREFVLPRKVQWAFPVKMTPKVAAPSFDGKRESPSNFAQEAEFWSRAANLNATNRAPAFVLHMAPAARATCMAVASDQLLGPDAGAVITQLMHELFAPDNLDCAYSSQGAVLAV